MNPPIDPAPDPASPLRAVGPVRPVQRAEHDAGLGGHERHDHHADRARRRPRPSRSGRAIAANPQNAAAILKSAAAAPAAAAFNAANNLVYDTLAAAAYRDMQIASAYQTIAAGQPELASSGSPRTSRRSRPPTPRINELNGRVLPVLGMITGQDLGAEPEKWKTWWTDQLGYVYQSNIPETKPTYTDTLTVQTPFTVGTTHTACFAAGTLVVTIDGPRAIESIQVGDRVLSQDPTTGLLSFRPVVAVHRNRPTPTLRIAVDGETIVATGIHRFWKAGKGWTMARDLKPGDRLRVVGGDGRGPLDRARRHSAGLQPRRRRGPRLLRRRQGPPGPRLQLRPAGPVARSIASPS